MFMFDLLTTKTNFKIVLHLRDTDEGVLGTRRRARALDSDC